MINIDFLKYPKMPNLENISSKDIHIMKAVEEKEIFYATEKIDGTNTQIAITKNEAKIGKRSSFIKKTEYPWVNIFGREKTQNLIKFIQSKIDDDILIRVYGETFGPKIQQNKYKLEEINFKVFTVIVEDYNNKVYCLGREDMEKLIPQEFLLKVLKKGTIEEISKNLAKKSNDYNISVKEGDVYNKFETYELVRNSKGVKGFLGIKHKNNEFKEVAKPTKKINLEMLRKEKELLENISRYITVNRLNNIISKGDLILEAKNIGKFIEAFQNDIREEYQEPIENKEMFDKCLKKLSGKIAFMVKDKINEIN